MKKTFISLLCFILIITNFTLPIKASDNLAINFKQNYPKINEVLSLDITNASGKLSYQWYLDNQLISNDDQLLIDESMINHLIKVIVSDNDETITKTIMVSNLPVIYINSEEDINSKETYVKARMDIQGNDLYPDLDNNNQGYHGEIEIRGRGNATWRYPKKPYKIKLAEKTNLLGMGSNKHFVLLANFVETSFMRNKLAYDLSNKLGLEYMQSTWVEVVLNGERLGNYQLCEQIRIDESRINIYNWEKASEEAAKSIAKANNFTKEQQKELEKQMSEDLSWVDNDEVSFNKQTYQVSSYYQYADIDGGFLYELDGYYDEISKFRTEDGQPIQYKNPEYINTSSKLFNYSKDYLQAVEDATTASTYNTTFNNETYHYQDLVDLNSLISTWLINELFFNADFMCQSTFMYKPHHEKLIMGPIWDMDHSSGNVGVRNYNKWQTYFFDTTYEGRAQDRQWYRYLCKDPFFVLKAKELYDTHYYDFKSLIIENGIMDQYYPYLKDSGELDYNLWGDKRDYNDFNQEFINLKAYLSQRLAWLDTHFKSIDTILTSLANYQQNDLSLIFTSDNQVLDINNDIIFLNNYNDVTLHLPQNTTTSIKLNGKLIYDNVKSKTFTFTYHELNTLNNELNVMEVITNQGKDIICFKANNLIDTTKLNNRLNEAKLIKPNLYADYSYQQLQITIKEINELLQNNPTSQLVIDNALTSLENCLLNLTSRELNPQNQVTYQILSCSSNLNDINKINDQDPTTYWLSDSSKKLPQSIIIDLQDNYKIDYVSFLPRLDKDFADGDIIELKIYTSLDNNTYNLIDTYQFTSYELYLINRHEYKHAFLNQINTRYLKIEITNALGDNNFYQYCSLSELVIYKHNESNLLDKLNNLLQQAKTYQEDLYTIESYQNLSMVMMEIDTLLNNPNLNDKQIKEAINKLNQAIDNLTYRDVDKTNLEELLKQTFNIDDYTKVSYQNYLTVKDEAILINNKLHPTQIEIDEITNLLAEAINDLVNIKALKVLINESYSLIEDDYTPLSWFDYQCLLTQANYLLAKDNATQDEINNLITMLELAKNSLVLKANKTLLQAEYDKAILIKANDYTNTSYDNLYKAMIKAKEILDDLNASDEQVSNALINLSKAIELLESKKVMNFKDVNSNDWFYYAIKNAYELDIMLGDGGNVYFSPNKDITRGMVATILYRIEANPKVIYAPSFKDVQDGLWYSNAIIWASNHHIVSGYQNKSFGPDDKITRQDLAIMLRNYALFKGINGNINATLENYDDYHQVSDYAYNAMNWCVANQIIKGSNNKLLPTSYATRAESAAMFIRLLDIIK